METGTPEYSNLASLNEEDFDESLKTKKLTTDSANRSKGSSLKQHNFSNSLYSIDKKVKIINMQPAKERAN